MLASSLMFYCSSFIAVNSTTGCSSNACYNWTMDAHPTPASIDLYIRCKTTCNKFGMGPPLMWWNKSSSEWLVFFAMHDWMHAWLHAITDVSQTSTALTFPENSNAIYRLFLNRLGRSAPSAPLGAEECFNIKRCARKFQQGLLFWLLHHALQEARNSSAQSGSAAASAAARLYIRNGPPCQHSSIIANQSCMAGLLWSNRESRNVLVAWPNTNRL